MSLVFDICQKYYFDSSSLPKKSPRQIAVQKIPFPKFMRTWYFSIEFDSYENLNFVFDISELLIKPLELAIPFPTTTKISISKNIMSIFRQNETFKIQNLMKIPNKIRKSNVNTYKQMFISKNIVNITNREEEYDRQSGRGIPPSFRCGSFAMKHSKHL